MRERVGGSMKLELKHLAWVLRRSTTSKQLRNTG